MDSGRSSIRQNTGPTLAWPIQDLVLKNGWALTLPGNGNLQATGQIWIINANGILFGKGSQINVAGLLATTSDIADGDFASGDLPAVNTVDAQISFKLPAIKSMIKIGGNNILNQYYYNRLGNPQIG